MPRPSRYSSSQPARVRHHFGLTQDELAYYLGVSRQQVAAVEAGLSNFSEAPGNRLLQLARHLLPPEGIGPVAPAFAPGTPAVTPEAAAPADLLERQLPERRLKRCRYYILQDQ